MITFITGQPGTGKTLFTLKRVFDDWNDAIESGERNIYYCGINQLNIPGWIEIQYEDVENWYKYPKGSIFVVDEVQKIWPGKNRGGNVSPGIQNLDTHRHGGYDFYIITQKPTNAHDQMRGYVGEHYHYDRIGGLESAREFFFNRAVNDPMTFPDKDDAVSVKRRQFPKEYYSKYKSSDMHTVQKKMPKMVYVYGGVLLTFLIGAGSFAYDLSNKPAQVASTFSDSDTLRDHPDYIPSYSSSDQPITTSQYIEQWKPRVDNIPYSAPAYDHLTEVQTFPRPQCIYRHATDTCKCYTQQATPLDMEYPICMSIVENGYFNPFLKEDEEREGNSGQAIAAASPPETTPVSNMPKITFLGSSTPIEERDRPLRPILNSSYQDARSPVQRPFDARQNHM